MSQNQRIDRRMRKRRTYRAKETQMYAKETYMYLSDRRDLLHVSIRDLLIGKETQVYATETQMYRVRDSDT